MTLSLSLHLSHSFATQVKLFNLALNAIKSKRQVLVFLFLLQLNPGMLHKHVIKNILKNQFGSSIAVGPILFTFFIIANPDLRRIYGVISRAAAMIVF